VNGHKKNPQEMARNYKNWLKAYMEYTRDSESPSTFHFWTGVSVIAGALRRRVWVDMKKFEWTPNFYIILVGPPGVAAKTTSIGMGMRLLAQIPGIKWGPESMTWQKLTRSLADSIEYLEFVNFQGQKERIAMSCNTIEVGELGTFLKTDDDALVSFLIRMWEGQRGKFRHETITGGAVEIDNPWLNIIAATTPAWMRDNFSESMIGGGLTSRVLFVYGDKKRSLTPYPDEVIPDAEYKLLQSNLISDLATISRLSGPYRLSQFAREWGRAWYTDHNNPDLRPHHLASPRFGGYISRKQTHLHKFAIILAAAKRDTLVIEEEDLREADQILTTTEHDMIKVFESIGVVDQRDHVEEIVSVVKYCGFLTNKGLWAKCMNAMTLKEFEEAVRAAVHSGKIKLETQGATTGVVAGK
jgi:hypothetical protein